MLRTRGEELTRRGWGLALTFLREPNDASDAVQQAFLVATRKPEQVPLDDPWPWFARVLALEASNLRRKRVKHTSVGDSGVGDNMPPDPHAPEPSRVLQQRELAAALDGALATLPAAERDAVVLTHVGGLAYEDACRTLNVPLGTFKHQLVRGMQRLRQKLGAADKSLASAMLVLPVLPVPDALKVSVRSTLSHASTNGGGSAPKIGNPLGANMLVKILALSTITTLLLFTFVFNRPPQVPSQTDLAAANAEIPPANRAGAEGVSGPVGRSDGAKAGAIANSPAPKTDDAGTTAANKPAAPTEAAAPKNPPEPKPVEPVEDEGDLEEEPKLGGIYRGADGRDGHVILRSGSKPNDVSKAGEPAAAQPELLTVLAAHRRWNYGEQFWDMIATADGKQIITAGKTLCWWDANDGSVQREIHLTDKAYSLTLSRDGKTLATTEAQQGNVRLWDPSTGKYLRTVNRQSGVNYVSFSADGKYLAGCGHCQPLLWNLQGDLKERAFAKPDIAHARDSAAYTEWTGEYEAVSFSADGSEVLAYAAWSESSGGNAVVAWNVKTGAVARRFVVDVNGFKLSPRGKFTADGKYLVAFSQRADSSDDRTSPLVVVDTQNGAVRELAAVDGAYTLAINPDGKQVAAGGTGNGGMIQLLALDTGSVLKTFNRRSVGYWAAFSPTGGELFVGSTDGYIRRWSTETGKPLNRHPQLGSSKEHIDVIANVALAGGRAISQDYSARVLVWDVASRKVEHVINDVWIFAVQSDGAGMATLFEGAVTWWNLRDGSKLRTTELGDGDWSGFMFCRNDSALFVARPGEARLYDAKTGKLLKKHVNSVSDGLYFWGLSPDGNSAIWYGGSGDSLEVQSMENGEFRTMTLSEGSDPVHRIRFTRDSAKMLVTRKGSCQLEVYDMATSNLDRLVTYEFPDAENAEEPIRPLVGAFHLSPDARFIFTGWWRLSAGENQALQRINENWKNKDLKCYTLATDGKTFAAVHSNGGIWIWRVQDTLQSK
ncbi:MAG: hypothetical protein IT462_13835 [Planctomycetes bacterium]|nr:hypothetical protein [Planctomycetota bacterium]